MRINSAGVIVNEISQAGTDFRVESNDLTHMLFVDSGANALGIGRIPSSVLIDAQTTSSGTATGLRLRNSGQVANSAIKQVFSLSTAMVVMLILKRQL